MAYFLVRWRNNQISDKKISILVGLLWGLMINFSLYSIFIGGWSALLLGGRRGIKNFIVSAFIALLLGSGTILSYHLSASQNEISNFGYSHLVYWGASLNSFAVPSIFHPIEQVRNLSRELYKGPHDESGVANAGIVTFVLVLIGIIAIFRKGEAKKYAYLFLLSLVGGVFALGPLLRWDGQIVSNCAFEPITNAIWQVGHALKPKLFEPSPPPGMNCGVPLPGLWLGSFIPFLEGARVSSRYMFVAVLGLIPIAAIGLSIFRPGLKVLFMALWLLEFLPNPIYGVPLDNQIHPVYTYVAQNLQTNEGIIEVTAAGMHMNGDVLYTSVLSNVPTANGYGSFWPKHTMDLWLYFLNRPSRWQEEETLSLLRQNRIRYVLAYRIGKQEEDLIAMMQQGPELQFEGCLDPLPNQSLRKFPICVFEVVDKEAYLTRTTGWSEREAWGIWAQGTESQMNLVVSQPTDLVLSISATPFCVEGKNQTITIFVNNVLLSEHLWQDCNIWSDRVQIPSSILQSGSNDVLLRYSYAARPVDVTNGQNSDPRPLSVGFLEMRVEKTGDGSR
ncbi:MAG: hypothetical protein WHS83_09490 [Chloroflexus sp.]|uniref:hypothetical protein n=1 Tax=Chloroflexus sp. TaxID=1904827 RepID=UPI0030B063D2